MYYVRVKCSSTVLDSYNISGGGRNFYPPPNVIITLSGLQQHQHQVSEIQPEAMFFWYFVRSDLFNVCYSRKSYQKYTDIRVYRKSLKSLLLDQS